MSVFSTSPRALLLKTLFKSFTATELWEEQLLKPGLPQGSGQRQDLAKGLQWQSSGWFTIYSPPDWAQDPCQLPGWCQGWPGARLLQLGTLGWHQPGVTRGWHQWGCAERVIQPSITQRWEAAAQPGETWCSFGKENLPEWCCSDYRLISTTVLPRELLLPFIIA